MELVTITGSAARFALWNMYDALTRLAASDDANVRADAEHQMPMLRELQAAVRSLATERGARVGFDYVATVEGLLADHEVSA